MLLLRWSFDAAAFCPDPPLWDEEPDAELDEGLTLYVTEDDPSYDVLFPDDQADEDFADDGPPWPEAEDFLQSADAGDESPPDEDDPTDFSWPEFEDFLADGVIDEVFDEPDVEGDWWSSPEPEDFIQPTPFDGDKFEDDEAATYFDEDTWWFDGGNIDAPPPPPVLHEVPHKHFLLSFGLLGGQWKH